MGVMTITGVPLAIIFLHSVIILPPDVLRDSRVPRIEFFSILCCHYDSDGQSDHKESRYKQVMVKYGSRCYWYTSHPLIHCSLKPTPATSLLNPTAR